MLPTHLEKFTNPIPVGHLGFVRLVDVMGDDAAIVQAARVSYGAGTKTVSDDRALIRYLKRHRHCYHPSMEVLTLNGWKKWEECSYEETFLVPNPKTNTLSPETCTLEVFDAEEEMHSFENNRMSYSVTPDHRMWFKPKYQENFSIIRASDMPKWGHFDPLAGYSYIPSDTTPSPLGKLIGFTLGDGSWSGKGLVFHLLKSRKKDYLRKCLAELGHTAVEKQSATYADATVFYLSSLAVAEVGLLKYLNIGEKSADKKISLDKITDLSILYGIFDGLTNSDGHINTERNERIEFSSVSPYLIKTFETLAAMLGMDAHKTYGNTIIAYPKGRTTLEARKEYFSTKYYSGKVFCATTSTGLLVVRGGPDKFAFVCGNTSPFEMCEIKLHLKLPIHVMRQLIRHRTASVNETSTRYSEVLDEFELFKPDGIRYQSTSNKQGSAGFVEEELGQTLSELANEAIQQSYKAYEKLREYNVAREQARNVLPLATYTECYWKIDVHNLFHLLGLRLDGHAQLEIRQFGQAIVDIVKQWLPVAYEAFIDYQLEACYLSRQEKEVLSEVIRQYNLGTLVDQLLADKGVSSRERNELTTKLNIEVARTTQ